MMLVIKCKNEKVFSACVEQYAGAEWIMQEYYYKAQGCIIGKQEKVEYNDCGCDHCESLEHNYEVLIDEIRSN